MQATELYNLSPVLRVMLLGLAVACGPISWVWLRNRRADARRRLAALTLVTLFLTFDLVLFGAFTRLTDSGLGCPDWPGCYGAASPSGAHAEITLAQQQMPTGPVTHTKAWIEMLHRYFATGVGVLILTLAVATWVRRREPGATAPGWPLFTLAWVCLQGAFGALTVTMKLQPAIVTMHLLGGLVLLALLTSQANAYRPALQAAVARRERRMLLGAFALLWLQVALGGWVSTNYAVLACSEFPKCQGTWWPPMDFAQGFELWRDLGKTGEGEHIAFAALTAIHYTHRLVAYVLLAVLGIVAWKLWRGPLARQARWLAGLAALQFLTGLSNVVFQWPLVAALLHTGGAAALVVAMVWALSDARRAAP